MGKDTRETQEILEPKKYDPQSKMQGSYNRSSLNLDSDDFDYSRIAEGNPFVYDSVEGTFRDKLQDREAFFPVPPPLRQSSQPILSATNGTSIETAQRRAPDVDHTQGPMSIDEFHWRSLTPSFRQRMLEASNLNKVELQQSLDIKSQQGSIHDAHDSTPSSASLYRGFSSPDLSNGRSGSNAWSSGTDNSFYAKYDLSQFEGLLPKSQSDNNFYGRRSSEESRGRPVISTSLPQRDGAHRHAHGLHTNTHIAFAEEQSEVPPPTPPKPPRTRSQSPVKRSLSSIDEWPERGGRYNVAVRDFPDSDMTYIRPPMKKLFGETGMLANSADESRPPSPRYRKHGISQWSSRFKERVEELTREFAFKMPAGALGRRGVQENSKFAVSLSPYTQAVLYMRLELLINIETNNFLMVSFTNNRISLSSLKHVTENWSARGRPQVIGFRYDLNTQRELVHLNIDTLPFKGEMASSRVRTEAVITAWGVLARELAVRTFCQPDSVVEKHLHDAERVLRLIGSGQDSVTAVYELRVKVELEIQRELEEAKTRPSKESGVEKEWNPPADFCL